LFCEKVEENKHFETRTEQKNKTGRKIGEKPQNKKAAEPMTAEGKREKCLSRGPNKQLQQGEGLSNQILNHRWRANKNRSTYNNKKRPNREISCRQFTVGASEIQQASKNTEKT